MSDNKKPRLPKPKDDLSALFPNREHEEAFHQWRRENAVRIKAFNENSDTIKGLLYAVSEFWYERVNEGWQDTIDLLSEQEELIEKLQAELPEAVKRGQIAATLANWDAIQAKQERLITLHTKARPAAIKKRQEKGEKNNADLDKAISDLFARSDSKGWRWTNDDIADFLEPHFYGTYKRTSILQRVKFLASKFRKEARKKPIDQSFTE